jgi:3D (Asp-Asp-Asp) domain-containing protein
MSVNLFVLSILLSITVAIVQPTHFVTAQVVQETTSTAATGSSSLPLGPSQVREDTPLYQDSSQLDLDLDLDSTISRSGSALAEITASSETSETSRSTTTASTAQASVKKIVAKPTYKWLTFTATFYAGDEPGMGNSTAIGTRPKAGRTIAVDPDVIPYGTKVYIEGWGYRIAEDCGGAIQGNRIDIYMNSVDDFPNAGRIKVRLRIVD